MFLCYIDETGNRDPRLEIPQRDGSTRPGDWLYVLTALCIFEQRWHTMEKPINRYKQSLIDRIRRDSGVALTLADCEVKSNWMRQPRERERHPLFSRLTGAELTGLSEVFFQQLAASRATILAVLVDKRSLPPGATQHDIHLRSWEALLELVERFMRARNHKHQALMINDDVSPEVNRMLALDHARLLDRGTRRDTWLRHICEMPMFVRSELCAGVQLADLCGYNIYRAFKRSDLAYPYFQRIASAIWTSRRAVRAGRPFSGLCILDAPDSPLNALVRRFENEQAPA